MEGGAEHIVKPILLRRRDSELLHEVDCECPTQSVIGFDDVLSAPFHIPRPDDDPPPLRDMGRAGAECLINRINILNLRILSK